MKLFEELKKKLEQKDNSVGIIGSEIKAKRLKLSRTLESVSEELCSVSYLCKIERSSINPNPKYIEQICERVNISKKHLDSLYNLEELIDEMVKSFYYDRLEKMVLIYNDIKELDNYRSSIIKLIYNIYLNNYLLCINYISEIEELVSVISRADLLVFSLFKSIFEIKTYKYKDSIQILKYIVQYAKIKEFENALANEYLLYGYLQMDSPFFLTMINKVININIKFNNLSKVENIRFKEGLYYFYKKDINRFNKICNGNFSFKYSNTLSLLKGILSQDLKNIIPDFISPYYEALYYAFVDKDKYEEFDKNILDPYEILYLNYINIKDFKDIELYKDCFFSAMALSSINLMKLFLEPIISKYKALSRYKSALELIEKYINVKKEIELIW